MSVHTATAGRFLVRRQSFTRRRVQITACGRRPAGTCRYRAGLSGISRSRTAAFSVGRSVQYTRRAVASAQPAQSD